MTPSIFRQLAAKTGVSKTKSKIAAMARSGGASQCITVVGAGDSMTSLYYTGSSPTSVTSVGTVATVTLTNHFQSAGSPVILETFNETAYNGCWTIASVIDANSFTVNLSATPSASPATGSGFVRKATTASNNGFMTWAMTICPGINYINSGLGGDTCAGLYARLQADVYSKNPDVVVLDIGTNDNNVGAGQLASLTWVGIKKIADDILSRNIQVILCTIAPIGVSSVYYNTSVGGFKTLQRTQQINRQIRLYAASTPGVILCDVYSRMVDTTQSDGRAQATFTQDELHQSPIGGAYVGIYELAPALQLAGAKPIKLVCSSQDAIAADLSSANVQRNPLFVTTGGSLGTLVSEGSGSGTSVALGWRCEVSGTATATASLVARTQAADGDNFGNNQVLVAVGVANNDTADIRSFITYVAQFTTGATLQASISLGMSGMSAVSKFNVTLQVTVGGVNYQATAFSSSTSTALFMSDWKGIVVTPKLYIPAGTITAYQIATNVTFSGSGGATITQGRSAIWSL